MDITIKSYKNENEQKEKFMLYGQLSEIDRFKVTRDYYKKLLEQYDNLIDLKYKYECGFSPKYNNWKEKNTDRLTGTSLRCYMKVSFEKLIELFGWPYIADEIMDGQQKSMVEWCLTIPHTNITFSIYNYKDHLQYCSHSGKSIIDITDWHIGGHDLNIINHLKEALANEENISFNILNGWK